MVGRSVGLKSVGLKSVGLKSMGLKSMGLNSYAVCLRHYFVWGEAPNVRLRGQGVGLTQPKVSALLNGQFRGCSVERLLRFVNALPHKVIGTIY